MTDRFTLFLMLLFPLSSSQISLHSKRDIYTHQDPAVIPALVRLRNQDSSHLNAKHARADQDHAKVGIFIAAAGVMCALMAAVYCIYNNFYNKQPYLHTQLDDGTEPMRHPSVFFQASSAVDVQRASFGSLSDTPSSISVAPCLSPPPSAMPFPPLFASSSSFSSSRSLRTISAKDLQRSFI